MRHLIKAKKIIDFSRTDGKKVKICANCCHFKLNLSVFHASAEGASEKFQVFYRQRADDIIIFKIQEGAFAPSCPPLLTPMFVIL